MSTALAPDSPAASTQEAPDRPERPRSWWYLPAGLAALAVIALGVFARGAAAGATTTFRLAREGDLNPGGIVPGDVALPAGGTALVLGLLCLAIAVVLGVLAATSRPWPRAGGSPSSWSSAWPG